MKDDERPADEVGAEPSPREREDEARPEPSESDFFQNEEHDGWSPIRRRADGADEAEQPA